jgi:hypothetical protein
MATAKIRAKIGVHEFEAEGSEALVSAQYNAWKEMVEKSQQIAPHSESTHASVPASLVTEVRLRDGYAAPWDIFGREKDEDLMPLRVHPPAGETRDADAILLIMYGYRKAGNQGEGLSEVAVTRLKESLDVSGLKVARIDRTAAPYVKAGYLLKSGRGKGGIYRLTVTGYKKAEEMAQKLFSQLV